MKTDAERLDFLEKHKLDVSFYPEHIFTHRTGQWKVTPEGKFKNTLREAIDSHIEKSGG